MKETILECPKLLESKVWKLWPSPNSSVGSYLPVSENAGFSNLQTSQRPRMARERKCVTVFIIHITNISNAHLLEFLSLLTTECVAAFQVKRIDQHIFAGNEATIESQAKQIQPPSMCSKLELFPKTGTKDDAHAILPLQTLTNCR